MISAIRSKTQRLQAKQDREVKRKQDQEKKAAEIEAVRQGKKAYYGDGRREQEDASKSPNKKQQNTRKRTAAPTGDKKKTDRFSSKRARKHMPDEFRRSAKNTKQ